MWYTIILCLTLITVSVMADYRIVPVADLTENDRVILTVTAYSPDQGHIAAEEDEADYFDEYAIVGNGERIFIVPDQLTAKCFDNSLDACHEFLSQVGVITYSTWRDTTFHIRVPKSVNLKLLHEKLSERADIWIQVGYVPIQVNL